MATMITDECINCGACEPECPNTAIYQGGVEWDAPDGTKHPALVNEFFYIVRRSAPSASGSTTTRRARPSVRSTAASPIPTSPRRMGC